MKSILVLASLALCAFAQQATIASPAQGALIFAGSTITVEVRQANSATDDQQGGIIMAFQRCPGAGSCDGFDPAVSGLGPNIVTAGAFTPKEDPSQPQKGLFQDFTFTVPSGSDPGPSVFSLAHLQAVGAEKIPVFNLTTVVVEIV